MISACLAAIFTRSRWNSLSQPSNSSDCTSALAWRGPCSRCSSASDATLRVRFAVTAATNALERASAADGSSVMDAGSGRSGRELIASLTLTSFKWRTAQEVRLKSVRMSSRAKKRLIPGSACFGRAALTTGHLPRTAGVGASLSSRSTTLCNGLGAVQARPTERALAASSLSRTGQPPRRRGFDRPHCRLQKRAFVGRTSVNTNADLSVADCRGLLGGHREGCRLYGLSRRPEGSCHPMRLPKAGDLIDLYAPVLHWCVEATLGRSVMALGHIIYIPQRMYLEQLGHTDSCR
jgi:hypothetical protein